MTRAERVRAALQGADVDRVPFTFWYHFRDRPRTGDGFLRATLEFYDTYRPDVLKVMHDADYELAPGQVELIQAADWESLPVRTPNAGDFAEHVRVLRRIGESIGTDAPVVLETVHGVFATAQKLTGGRLLAQLGSNPGVVRQGLERLANALADYARAAIESGNADGIFLAIGGADAETMTASSYEDVFLPLERNILAGAGAGWCNVVHLHGESLHMDAVAPLIADAPALSWSDRVFGPALGAVRERTGKCVVGGVNEQRIGGSSPASVAEEIHNAMTQTDGGHGLIVAPGCTVPTEVPPANLTAFVSAVSDTAKSNGKLL